MHEGPVRDQDESRIGGAIAKGEAEIGPDAGGLTGGQCKNRQASHDG